jgi:hypothetical protein
VQGSLGDRRAGSPRIEIEVEKHEIERDAPADSGPSLGPDSNKDKGESSKDDSNK